MTPRSFALVLSALYAVVALPSAHAASFDTPEARLKFIKKKGNYDMLVKQFGCEDVALQYQSTETEAGIPYDHYLAKGCGAEILWIATTYSEKNSGVDMITWRSSIAAPDTDFEAAIRTQLQAAAAFDLGCTDTQFVTLHAVNVPLHNKYQASIGVTGCDKKLTYDATCNIVGVKDGKAEITCVNNANASPTAH